MIYITGDTHRDFQRFHLFDSYVQLEEDDIMIILGDVGLNYFLDERDIKSKKELSEKFKCTFFCIHGNREARPSSIKSYQKKVFCGGLVYYEAQYPNLLFAKDGEIYTFTTSEGDLKCLVCGGAYSVNKSYFVKNGFGWFPDEQPQSKIKGYIEKAILENPDIDIIFTHTCPKKYIPNVSMYPNIDKKEIDRTTEAWFDAIERKINYKKWYCGHFHINRSVDKMQFLYDNVEDLFTKML